MNILKTTALSIMFLAATTISVNAKEFIGVGLGVTVDRDGDTEETTVNLQGKVDLVEFDNNVNLSVMPFLNTASELGGALTVGFEPGEGPFEVYGGLGGAYRFGKDSVGALTGIDNNIVVYSTLGVLYEVNRDVIVYLDGKLPFGGQEAKEPVIQVGAGWQF